MPDSGTDFQNTGLLPACAKLAVNTSGNPSGLFLTQALHCSQDFWWLELHV